MIFRFAGFLLSKNKIAFIPLLIFLFLIQGHSVSLPLEKTTWQKEKEFKQIIGKNGRFFRVDCNVVTKELGKIALDLEGKSHNASGRKLSNLRKRPAQRFEDSFSEFPDSTFKDIKKDKDVSFVAGFTYYIPFSAFHNKYDSKIRWGEATVLKGDLTGVTNTLHKNALTNPGIVSQLHQQFPIFHKRHTGKSLRAVLVDSSKGMITTIKGKTETKIYTDSTTSDELRGFSIREEIYFDQNDHLVNTRINFVLPQKIAKRKGMVIGYNPLYALPLQCPYGQCKKTKHPLLQYGTGGYSVGLGIINKESGKHKWLWGKPYRIANAGNDYLGRVLVQAAQKENIILYKDRHGKKSFIPDLKRNGMEGMLVRELAWYDQSAGKFKTRIVKLGIFHNGIKTGASNAGGDKGLKDLEPLFWYIPAKSN